MRWNKRYDGTKESLVPKSHRPHSPHPNAHTEQELKWIKDYHRRNPNISLGELYGKLREDKAYSRHPGSLYRVFVRLGFRKKAESTKKKSLHNKPYDTPTAIGIKWQMDVKFVPKVCYVGKDDQRFYQYTIIEEASRKRFIYAYEENSSFSTIDFVKRPSSFSVTLPKPFKPITARSSPISSIQSGFIRSMCSATVIILSISSFVRGLLGTTERLSEATETTKNASTTT